MTGDKLMVPTVHLNGTGQTQLLEQLMNAVRGLHVAIDLVKEAAPHGRDYYVQDRTGAILGEPIQRAREQHVNRLVRLESVARELEEIAFAVSQQGNKR